MLQLASYKGLQSARLAAHTILFGLLGYDTYPSIGTSQPIMDHPALDGPGKCHAGNNMYVNVVMQDGKASPLCP